MLSDTCMLLLTSLPETCSDLAEKERNKMTTQLTSCVWGVLLVFVVVENHNLDYTCKAAFDFTRCNMCVPNHLHNVVCGTIYSVYKAVKRTGPAV